MSRHSSPSKRLISLVVFGCTLTASAAQAFELSGTWATAKDVCSKVFTKKGNEIVFTRDSEEFGSGFVVAGNQIRGKAARCIFKSTKQAGDVLTIPASCSSDIIVMPMTLNVKILDDNRISRIFPDPDLQGIETVFYRCDP